MPIQSQNPATGEVVKTFEALTGSQIDLALARSVIAQQSLRGWSFEKRSKAMRRASQILRDESETLGKIMTTEMGKTLKSAIVEVEKCASCTDYYADNAADLLADETIQSGASLSYRRYLPLGPILAVMPWNFPIWQVIRFAAPALMAGNSALLKHASNVPQCALYIKDIFKRAGFPQGAFATLLIGGDQVEAVLRDERVRGVTLTGSEPAGRAVAAIAGEEIKPSLLELGGSDAFIVMPSADMDKAVQTAVTARTQNNGQSCIAGKRFIVHADIYEDFKARFKAAFDALTVGDPMDAVTDIGPLVDASAVETLCDQVKRALKAGAICVTGAQRLDGLNAGGGNYFRPGILENIPKDNDVYYEEFFGPVALLIKAQDLDEAISIANDSPFGLGSVIFTTDPTEQEAAIARLEAGATFVNAMTSSDPRLPFGGIKNSGYGRELASEGIRTFCNVKTVYIA